MYFKLVSELRTAVREGTVEDVVWMLEEIDSFYTDHPHPAVAAAYAKVLMEHGILAGSPMDTWPSTYAEILVALGIMAHTPDALTQSPTQ